MATPEPDIIAAFLDYLRYERRYSQSTVDSYGEDLHLFEVFFRALDEGLSWQTIDHDVVRDWVERQMDNGNSAATVNRRLSALRSLYRYALRQRYVDSDPVRIVKGPKKTKPLPKFLKEGEIDALIDDYEWQDTFVDLRDKTMILLFYTTGMRAGELINLNDADIDFVGRELHVIGKGNKQRNIPFADELCQALKTYMARRNHDVARNSTALIVNEQGKRLNYYRVRNLVRKRLAAVTTQKHRSPHVLRHTFATAMMNHDTGIETVKELLGHESIATTEIYTHATFEQLKSVYEKAHPRA